MKNKYQTLLLLCSLPSSYKSFKEAIIYGGKSTVNVNVVKEHLLNKDKIDTQLTDESRHDDSGKVHYSREKGNNESFMGNSKHMNLTCNYYHKKRHIRADYWLRKKKQSDATVTDLIEEDEESVSYTHLTLPTIYSV